MSATPLPAFASAFAAPAAELRPPFAFPLRAGPVTLTFVDGDLRHLRAGGEELIRRVTFNVRHHRWDTAAWRLDSLRLQQGTDFFFLHFSALCEVAGAPYTWSADIVGERDGTISYAVVGEALADCAEIRRAGLNVLYANECVLGQPFETAHLDGKVVQRTFPELVPAQHLPAVDFSRLTHRTRGGANVTIEIEGAHFGLEDQRVAGDDSFKAFSGLRHTYAPLLTKGDRAEKSLVIRVSCPACVTPPAQGILTLGAGEAATALPALALAVPPAGYGMFHELTRRPAAKNGIFLDVNLAPGRCHGAKALTWGWYPTVNLHDDEMIMDNAASIAGQLRSARRLAPEASLRIDPIALDSLHPRTVPRDSRNDTPFGAAWLLAATQHLAAGGAHEAAFAIDGPYARAVLAALAPHAGRRLREVTLEATADARFAAFAYESPAGLAIWLANLTSETQPLALSGLPPDASVSIHRLHAGTGPGFREFPAGFTDPAGGLVARLAPHEVRRVQF